MEGLVTASSMNGTMTPPTPLPSKTPVSLLQEVCAKGGLTPKYDLLQVEGAVHEPTFLYRATVGEYVATGQGQSKKKAKHAAAKAVLDQMMGSQVPGQGATPPVDTPGQLTSPYDDGIPGNPVGQLQELCMSRRWPPPTYELVKEEGLPHERTFTIACCIGVKYKEIGVGKSKKIAKRQASFQMFQLLRDSVPTEGVNILENDDDEIAQRMTAHFSGLRDSKVPALTRQGSVGVSQFHRALKTSKAPKITELQKCQLSMQSNYVQFLQEIAAEQDFEVTWVDIDEKSTEGRYQCLVQLATMPVAVCYGTGAQPADAKNDAAHNALQYLQIMVKK